MRTAFRWLSLVKGSVGGLRRQISVALLALVVAGCGSDAVELGTLGAVEGFLGGVAADEPRAAAVGRDVLSAGGTAADAVVAMYFASAVTLPASASLGGGGACVAFDSDKSIAKAIVFLPAGSIAVTANSDRPTAVPASVRGMVLLHARFGRLRWEQLLAPAESLARFGFPASRALVNDLTPLRRALQSDPEFMRIFASPRGGGLVAEGDPLIQVELAAVISHIRTQGAGAFYTGPLAQRLVDSVKAAGGSLSVEELRDYAPSVLDPIRVPWGNQVAHFAPPPAAGGAVAAQMWALLEDQGFGRASPEGRQAMLVDVGAKAMADRERWMRADGSTTADPQSLVAPSRLKEIMAGSTPGAAVRPENASAASLVAFDRDGSAAACAVTLNSPFGTGRVAPGTGIVLAAAPGPGGRGAEALGPMLIVNENVGAFHFAGAASGGIAAPTALVGVAAQSMLADVPLAEAVAAKRALGTADPALVYTEQGAEPALREGGGRAVPAQELGRVNAAACPGGYPPDDDRCAIVTDPRGYGLATGSF